MGPTIRVTEALSRPVAEYAHAVRSGPFLLVGAKGATRPDGPVPLGRDFAEAIRAQGERTVQNVDHVVSELGSALEDVVHMTVFLTDYRFQEEVDRALDHVGAGPARTYLPSPAFALPELLFEVDLVATTGGPRNQISDGGRTLAAWSDGWLFSSSLVARRHGATCAEELSDVAAQLDDILSSFELSWVNVARLRVVLADARDSAVVESWLDARPGPKPAVTTLVGVPSDPGRTLSADIVACVDAPERVPGPTTAGAAFGVTSTAAVCTRGVVFTAAAAPARPSVELGVAPVLRTLEEVTSSFGLRLADVAKVDGVLADWRSYPTFREEYLDVMSSPFPTRSLTQGQPRRQGAAFQLAWIAVTGGHDTAVVLAPPGEHSTEVEVN